MAGIAFFPSLEQAVHGLTDLQLRTSGAQTLVEAMVEFKRISSEIVVTCWPATIEAKCLWEANP